MTRHFWVDLVNVGQPAMVGDDLHRPHHKVFVLARMRKECHVLNTGIGLEHVLGTCGLSRNYFQLVAGDISWHLSLLRHE
ncbi:hypothetical protein D3C84_1179470 [compost metagenome]